MLFGTPGEPRRSEPHTSEADLAPAGAPAAGPSTAGPSTAGPARRRAVAPLVAGLVVLAVIGVVAWPLDALLEAAARIAGTS